MIMISRKSLSLAYMYVMTEGTKLHGIVLCVFNKDLDKHWVMVTAMVYKLVLPSFECFVQQLVFPVHCLMIMVSLSLSLMIKQQPIIEKNTWKSFVDSGIKLCTSIHAHAHVCTTISDTIIAIICSSVCVRAV